MYVKSDDGRIEQQNGYTIAYQKLDVDIHLFGHIQDILLVHGSMLFAVQNYWSTPMIGYFTLKITL